jgi:hypothetical protein
MPRRTTYAKRRKARWVWSRARAGSRVFPNALLRDRPFLPCKSFVLGAGEPVWGGVAHASAGP